jgi:hypothetical protein
MSKQKQTQTKPATVGDMTRDELKTLIREVLEDMLWPIEQAYTAEDDLPLKPEFAEELQRRRDTPGRIYSAEEVRQKLGLDE